MNASVPPKTFISDLRASRAATIEATVAKLEPIRENRRRDGQKKRVRNGRLKDDTGDIGLLLWGRGRVRHGGRPGPGRRGLGEGLPSMTADLARPNGEA